MMVYTSPDLLESSPHALGFMNRGESPISGFQHYLKKGLSRFYEEIKFVWTLSHLFHHYVSTRKSRLCHKVSSKIIRFLTEEHIYDHNITLTEIQRNYDQKSTFT